MAIFSALWKVDLGPMEINSSYLGEKSGVLLAITMHM